jgi:hypothetical protein
MQTPAFRRHALIPRADEREAEWLDLWREIKAPENKAALRSYLAALR